MHHSNAAICANSVLETVHCRLFSVLNLVKAVLVKNSNDDLILDLDILDNLEKEIFDIVKSAKGKNVMPLK